MIDWTSSMRQTYEFYIVDPNTWKDAKPLNNVKSCTIDWDRTSETICSAKITCDEQLDECYVRIYLVVNQNGNIYKEALGTVLVQTPGVDFDGKSNDVSLEAYSPLLELSDKKPPLGYTITKNEKIMVVAGNICKNNMRAPVVEIDVDKTLDRNFTAEINESWLSYVISLISSANYRLMLDGMGRVMFAPMQRDDLLNPIFSFNDDNSSILLPDISLDRDLYGIPNVVEVIYSYNNGYLYSRAVNNNVASPVSVPKRGREVIHRVTDVSLPGSPNQEQLDAYAEQLLSELSTLEFTVTFKHGYYPVRIGDAVMLNYRRAKMSNIKATIVSQSIDCTAGCVVTEKAVFTNNLWKENVA